MNYGPIPTVQLNELPDPLPEALQVLDVREPVEWQHGHIEGAVHVPLSLLPLRLDELPAQETLVVCRVGARSAQATAYLLDRGRTAVNLGGGMVGWADAGRPMVSEYDGPPSVV